MILTGWVFSKSRKNDHIWWLAIKFENGFASLAEARSWLVLGSLPTVGQPCYNCFHLLMRD